MTARRAAEIAEACREYLAAHDRRRQNYPVLTPAEVAAVAVLRYLCDPRTREEVSPTTGTAA